MKALNNKSLLIFLFIFTLVLTACGNNDEVNKEENGESGGDLLFGTVAETPSLDPFLDAADERSKRTVLMYEGLTWVNKDMEVEGRIAHDWDVSDDGLTYTFYIREDAYFHNGDLVTPEDVKYSYDLFLDEEFGTAGAGDFESIESIEVTGDHEVTFNLSSPYSTLLAAVGGRYGAVIPEGTYDDGDLRNNEVGTGPYVLENWNENNNMTLQRFDDYWNDDIGYLDTITVQIVPDNNSLVASLKSGEIDLAILGDPSSYNDFDDNSELQIEKEEALRWSTLDFANDTEPFDNLQVREAIAKGIDKQEIMEAGTDGVGTVIGTMPTAFSDWVVDSSSLPNQERDVEGAIELLEEAGYGEGLDMPLRIISDFSWMRAAAEVVASNLSEIGVNVEIESVELSVWADDWDDYASPNTFNEWGGFTDPDLLYYRHFRSRPEGGDWRRWDNSEADELLDTAREESDKDVRIQKYNEFQILMAEDLPSIPLFSADDVSVAQPNIEDYQHHPSGWWYGLAYTNISE